MTANARETASVDALVSAFKAGPDRRFSDAEADALANAADRDLWAAKAAALHFYRNGDIERALGLMRSIAEREPRAENIKNVAVMLGRLGRFAEGIAWIGAWRERLDALLYHDLLCGLHRRAGDIAAAVAHGDAALALKDATPPSLPPSAPILHQCDLGEPRRNVIAFSIWGGEPRYLDGALTNAIVARYLYPGWTPRFYTDASTSDAFRTALTREGAEIRMVEGLPAGRYGLFWRFLVEDDPEVRLYLCRDADSVMTAKERWAVADWLGARTAFHVMRDDPSHSEPMLAGLWGAHRGNVGDMRGRIDAWLASAGTVANHANKDQEFLRAIVWPIARGSLTAHDGYFDFMQPRRFDPGFALPGSMHVGQNDWVHRRRM